MKLCLLSFGILLYHIKATSIQLFNKWLNWSDFKNRKYIWHLSGFRASNKIEVTKQDFHVTIYIFEGYMVVADHRWRIQSKSPGWKQAMGRRRQRDAA